MNLTDLQALLLNLGKYNIDHRQWTEHQRIIVVIKFGLYNRYEFTIEGEIVVIKEGQWIE